MIKLFRKVRKNLLTQGKTVQYLKYAIGEIILVVFLLTLISCESGRSDQSLRSESPSQDETEQIDRLLRDLYQSFSYDSGVEPDWELMRSVFIEGAQFVTEAVAGAPPQPQTIEDFISSWQHSIRNSASPPLKTSERIIETTARKTGRLIYVDVVFQASKSGDPSPRKPGLDSLILVNVDGVWKVLSFIIHYESKL
ncbi:MAG: hypothetical protein HEP71_24795 [Roseivirga sp.]|nr:hypothetical protein [Roseivirga sp.]